MKLKLVAQPLECLFDELRAIIMDDSPWDAKAVDNVTFDKFDYV